MNISNRNILTIFAPDADADRLIEHCLRGGIEAFVPVSSTAGPAHEYMDIWAATPDAAPDLTAVLEEDVLTGDPTSKHIEEALETHAEVDLQASSEEEMEDQDLVYLREAWSLQRRNFRYCKELSNTEADAEVDLAAVQVALREKIYNLLDAFAEWAAAKGGHWRGWFGELSTGQGDAEFSGQHDVEADQIVSDWREQRDREENSYCPQQLAEAKEAQAEQDEQIDLDAVDWVTVENGDGTTRQIAGTQHEEDLASGLLVNAGGYLMYKSQMHRAAEERDDDYISRLEVHIRSYESEIAPERTPVVHATKSTAADDDIDYFANLATNDGVRD